MNYYNEIKKELLDNEINKKVKNYLINRSDLKSYYKVGKILKNAGKHYGEGIIKEYSQKLKHDLNKNYSVRTLYKMLKYYNFVSDMNLPTVSAKLSWSHYDEILKFEDVNKIIYYINVSEQQNLSVRQLRSKIKSKEYERLPSKTRNIMIKKTKMNVVDFVKNPIIIKNTNKYENISEKILQRLILENIEFFMKELGNAFCFIGSEYKLNIENTYNYVDLLLFNIEYNCYVIVELKVTELKKEHIGQIQVYMNYIDDNLKKDNQEKTIGIIICKQDNNYVIKYCSDKRIISREYILV